MAGFSVFRIFTPTEPTVWSSSEPPLSLSARKFLTVKVNAPTDRILQYLRTKIITNENGLIDDYQDMIETINQLADEVIPAKILLQLNKWIDDGTLKELIDNELLSLISNKSLERIAHPASRFHTIISSFPSFLLNS